MTDRGDNEISTPSNRFLNVSLQILIGIAVICGFYLSSLYSYTLFHSIIEIFSIIVSSCIFLIAWNTRRFQDSNYMVFLGISLLFITIIDILHTLAYKGMGVFQGYDANLPTQLWIIMRYMLAISFLVAPIFIRRKVNAPLVLFLYSAVTFLLLLLVFYWGIFPACYIEGAGLTPFKIYSEYIISLILLGSLIYLILERKAFARLIFGLLFVSIVLSIAAELAFTTYASVYGFSNMLGHMLIFVSFYLIYKALIETGLTKPYDLMFRNLKSSEMKNRIILEQMYESYFEVDLAGKFTLVNESTCLNLGYSREELIGKSYRFTVPEDDIKPLMLAYNEVFRTGEPNKGFEHKILRKDGSIMTAESSISLLKNGRGDIIGFRSISEDITQRKQMEQKLQEMSTHDFLTGLPNRVLLQDRYTMAAALAHRNKACLAVMSLDLDKFKLINDVYGHSAGDQVLKVISARLTAIIRASDTLARIGGDEFILMMLESNHMEDSTAIAQKILDSFKEPVVIEGNQLHLSTSIGIATYPSDAMDMETLIKFSDAAMYYAKGHGRNQFKFFNDGDIQVR